ncbi:glycoprotein hormone beta-5-like [Acanthaster planci]|uniref:Glycoprotein hormone beta-5-like n=1 Tax=Acanthaster planci TaxID=133434 RepID=A0A8B7Y5J8_ACAPL|nr:glycoprotein hormone beta-5-like [Acanthaster planci]
MASRSIHACVLAAILLTIWACALAIDPSTATGCYVHNAMSHVVQKDGCRPYELIVSGCWGRCATVEVPALNPPFVSASHSVCGYTSYEERHVELPDCDPGVDPGYTYLHALRCECTTIDSTNTNYSYRPDYFVSKK